MMSPARSMTRLEDGETSMAFSFKARPFMQSDSAAYSTLAYESAEIVNAVHTSSWDEKMANPVPVGLCWSGVRRVQNAMGRPPN